MGFKDDYNNGEDIMEKYDREGQYISGFHIVEPIVYVDEENQEVDYYGRRKKVKKSELKDPESSNF